MWVPEGAPSSYQYAKNINYMNLSARAELLMEITLNYRTPCHNLMWVPEGAPSSYQYTKNIFNQ